MTLQSLYNKYFQKSKIFLYPALGIKKGAGVTPLKTYVQWEGHYTPEDRKLICLYYLRDDQEFLAFEKKILLENKMFHDFKQVSDNEGVYIFDYNMYAYEWNCFMKGKYSQMSDDYKKKLLGYHRTEKSEEVTSHLAWTDSYLNPDKYFEIYSNILGIDKEDLERIGELCDLPDMERETLISNVKSIEIKTENYEERS